jgi:hypothetical protein
MKKVKQYISWTSGDIFQIYELSADYSMARMVYIRDSLIPDGSIEAEWDDSNLGEEDCWNPDVGTVNIITETEAFLEMI